MFTIKHISPRGNEALYAATEVSYTHAPGAERLGRLASEPNGSVWFKSPTTDGLLAELQEGSVYVMNDKGATVAKYDLGGWPAPVGNEAAAETLQTAA
jgi:hypothetical protein